MAWLMISVRHATLFSACGKSRGTPSWKGFSRWPTRFRESIRVLFPERAPSCETARSTGITSASLPNRNRSDDIGNSDASSHRSRAILQCVCRKPTQSKPMNNRFGVCVQLKRSACGSHAYLVKDSSQSEISCSCAGHVTRATTRRFCSPETNGYDFFRISTQFYSP